MELQLLRQRRAVFERMPSDRRDDDSDSDSETGVGSGSGSGSSSSSAGSCFGASGDIPVTAKAVEARLTGARALLAVCIGNINDALEELRYEGAEWGVE